MTSQIKASTLPTEHPPGIWTFWRLACSNSLPSNAPPISTEIPLLEGKFRLQSNTVRTFQREICRDHTFKLLLKTFLKELFTNKGEILSCKSVKTLKKNEKNAREYYARTRDKSGSNSPPFQDNVQFSSSLWYWNCKLTTWQQLGWLLRICHKHYAYSILRTLC